MRAVGAAMTLSCAMVFLPSVAFADHIDVQGAKQCLIDVDKSTPGDHVRGGSVGLSSVGGGGSVGVSSNDTMAESAADATFTRRSGMENSRHFVNQGSPQPFADDRTSFDDDVIAFNDIRHGVVGQILAGLQDHHEGPGRGSAEDHDGDHGGNGHHGEHGGGGGVTAPRSPSIDPAPGPNPVLVPQPADATPNPEPASMILIGTGLAGLYGFRRRLLP